MLYSYFTLISLLFYSYSLILYSYFIIPKLVVHVIIFKYFSRIIALHELDKKNQSDDQGVRFFAGH